MSNANLTLLQVLQSIRMVWYILPMVPTSES